MTHARFAELPLGAVRPAGWLRRQLELQARGITGRLEDVWADVGPDSAWRGGSGEDWERGPYYLDGLVPLAHVLGEQRLLDRARPWIEWILGSQDEDGQFGPRSNLDWWPRTIALKVLTQHADATGDGRVLPFVARYAEFQLATLPGRPLEGWAAARGMDAALSVHWLQDRDPRPQWLELAELLEAQTLDWPHLLRDGLITGRATRFAHATHGPNVAMGLKADAVWFLRDGDPGRRARTVEAFDRVERWHGLAHGWPSGDEWLAGRSPVQGTETCQVVEHLFTASQLTRILGDPRWGDDLESLAFNLLPASSDPQLLAHQYLQQPNQVGATVGRRNWTFSTDGANVFGFEPHFGCCTANLHQGWPKFVRALWLGDGDDLVAISYAPCTVEAQLGGTPVHLDVRTEYPFEETVRIRVSASRPAVGAIRLRVPGWCGEPLVRVAGVRVDVAGHDGWLVLNRTWADGDEIDLTLPMSPQVARREAQAATVRLGPLQLVVTPGENWTPVAGAPGIGEWHVHPRTNWNYGIVLDGAQGTSSWSVERGPVGELPFAATDPPVRLGVFTGQVRSWQAVGVDAGPLPDSPTRDWVVVERAQLVPYGCARTRITEMPVLDFPG